MVGVCSFGFFLVFFVFFFVFFWRVERGAGTTQTFNIGGMTQISELKNKQNYRMYDAREEAKQCCIL